MLTGRALTSHEELRRVRINDGGLGENIIDWGIDMLCTYVPLPERILRVYLLRYIVPDHEYLYNNLCTFQSC